MVSKMQLFQSKESVGFKAALDEEAGQKIALGDEVVKLKERCDSLNHQLNERFVSLHNLLHFFVSYDVAETGKIT